LVKRINGGAHRDVALAARCIIFSQKSRLSAKEKASNMSL
jgi:hypothetical protein